MTRGRGFARKRWLATAALLAAVAGSAAMALAAVASPGSAKACGVVVKAMDGEKMIVNKYFQDGMHFSPGTVSVKSGCAITFEYGTAGQSDPHTLTIVPKGELPQTTEQVDNCTKACALALPALKNPEDPSTAGTPANPIVHWFLNKGQTGLDEVGQSLAIAPVPGHKSITVTVTAKPGTTLYFMCAVHPWMQGKIVVT